MGKIIEFPQARSAKKTRDKHLLKMKELSDQIDALVLGAVNEGMDPHEIAGLLAHRLGTLLRPIDDKTDLWDVCEKVLKKQAVLE